MRLGQELIYPNNPEGWAKCGNSGGKSGHGWDRPMDGDDYLTCRWCGMVNPNKQDWTELLNEGIV